MNTEHEHALMLIARQQLEIEKFKEIMQENRKTKKTLKLRFIAIGAPLNDNMLHFNREQLIWAQKTLDLIETIG